MLNPRELQKVRENCTQTKQTHSLCEEELELTENKLMPFLYGSHPLNSCYQRSTFSAKKKKKKLILKELIARQLCNVFFCQNAQIFHTF